MSMDYDYQSENSKVRNITVKEQPISGFIQSIVSFFYPAVYGLAFIALSIIPNAPLGALPLILAGLALIGLIIWADGVVKCVSQIAKYFSKTAEVGLFILLVGPVLQVVIFMVFGVGMLAEMLPSSIVPTMVPTVMPVPEI